ncbi:hypothetical protein PHYC_02457 [Phycisphaerales bacterium]|nr:hypothetical protein PHYC_02457 [Phycisphaerales bacterium]
MLLRRWSEGTTAGGRFQFLREAAHDHDRARLNEKRQSIGMRYASQEFAEYGINLNGFRTNYLSGVSDDGMTFAGIGVTPQGCGEGVVAHVPTPTSCLGLAAITVLGRSRRRRPQHSLA